MQKFMYSRRGVDMQDLVIVKMHNKEIVRKNSTDNTQEHMNDHSCWAVSYTEMPSFNWTWNPQ